MVNRCSWAGKEDMIEYHDKEWGVEVHNDKKLFEFLILEGAQAGLSWSTILKRREGYREAFCDFDVEKVSKLTLEDEERLLKNEKIIRNKLKIKSAIGNAKAFIKIQKEFGSFDKYIWGFVDEKIVNNIKKMKDVPVNTFISDSISKDLKKRGFNFVGSTICYAFMQAIGMVNDHEVSCFRFEEV
jgi:DNA-3-methyladenine glycosylase I